MRRAHGPLVLLVLGAALVGCSGAGDEPATPEGWQRVQEGALSFAVPGEWVDVAPDDDVWSLGWADAADLEDAGAVLVGAPAYGEQGAEAGYDLFTAGAQVGGWGYASTGRATPVDTETLEVWRNDFTYDDVDGVFWSAADPRTGTTVALQLTGRDLSPALVEGIQASLAVVDPDA